MFERSEELLLCHFDAKCDLNDAPDYIKLLWACDWVSILKQPANQQIISNIIEDNPNDLNDVQCVVTGIAALNLFCEFNIIGPRKANDDEISKLWSNSGDISNKLTVDSEEIFATIVHPELLYISYKIFEGLSDLSLIYNWWKLRCFYVYQRVLDERSATLWTKIEDIIGKIDLNELPDDKLKYKALYYLELNQIYLLHGKLQKSEECLNIVKDITGLGLELKGALGKRTKFQQSALAQLTLNVTMEKLNLKPALCDGQSDVELQEPLKLDDDVRLEKIHYEDITENNLSELTSLEQTICLNTLQYVQRSQPKDELADEELFPYINVLLAQNHGPWSVRMCSLLIKCKLESNHKRTVERSMMQCEEIVNNIHKSDPSVHHRLSYIWASGLPLIIHCSSQLADLMLSIGLVKAALDLYLELQLWEEVIACYTVLELRHKAAEIIQQQIDINPTAKLYCLLGDATDDVSLYEKAWEFSNHKSSKAQRHWGNYLFAHKKYDECIPHYQKSCEINSLQELVWLRLGYAALSVENWELAATAYRRYTYLEPNSFEAWNNLAKVYVKQGSKQRAYKSLNEALRYNYDNWKVWENFVVVSIDTGHFDDVVRGYNRILDLRGKHLDNEVLGLLVKAIVNNSKDADGNESKRIIRKVLELFGRITAIHPADPTVWQFYADVSPTPLLRGQRLLRSYAGHNQKQNWFRDLDFCKNMVTLTENLANTSLEANNEYTDQNKMQIAELLSSTRLTIQAVIRVISKEQPNLFTDEVEKLQSSLNSVTTELKNRMA